MGKCGIRSQHGDINLEIYITNQKLRQLKARISKLQSGGTGNRIIFQKPYFGFWNV